MKRAILYSRVSSDEQNMGYSPADQKEKLYNFSKGNEIEVLKFYHEDESGKSFDRPEWNKIMQYIRKNPKTVDIILFVKWDRFSRNIAEAYIAIKELKKYGVECQALEQPLNFEIPESKIMLAIYLAAPEVDNDRRALNIFNGIRKGKKEGRWLGACLRGYINTRDENDRPIILPEGGKKQRLVVRAFKLFATNTYNIEELRRKLGKEGLKCARNSFWELLRNRGYLGQVFIPAYKDEPAKWIRGTHKALIDEKTFNDVQDILEGRRKKFPCKYKTVRDEFPLRGFLVCPHCSKNMTGSGSRGKMGNLFFYYHCQYGCKVRYRASDINQGMVELISDLKANKRVLILQAKLLKNRIKKKLKTSRVDIANLDGAIQKQNQRLQNAKSLMLDGDITPTEFKEMKSEIEETIVKLSLEQDKLKTGFENFDPMVDACVEVLEKLDYYFKIKPTEGKQRIISSIFLEKLVFENNKYRTPAYNRAIPLICRENKVFRDKKGRKLTGKNEVSCRVEPGRFELPSKQGTKMLSTRLAVF